VADYVVRPTQTAFMQGCYILDEVVTLHETFHELRRKNMKGVILKIDFKKAYGKVKWSFLQETLKMKDFLAEWRTLIHNFFLEEMLPLKSVASIIVILTG
jgi:hypothetical protein